MCKQEGGADRNIWNHHFDSTWVNVGDKPGNEARSNINTCLHSMQPLLCTWNLDRRSIDSNRADVSIEVPVSHPLPLPPHVHTHPKFL